MSARPPNKLILGLIGRKRAGKDTLCRILQSWYPEAVRIAIADPLKEDIARRFDVTLADIERDKELWRPVLQWWGDMRRPYWTAKAFLRMETADTRLVVVTDARYPDQFDLIRAKGGLLIRVERPSIGGPPDLHASETNVDGVKEDLAVWNPGDATFASHLGELKGLLERRLK